MNTTTTAQTGLVLPLSVGTYSNVNGEVAELHGPGALARATELVRIVNCHNELVSALQDCREFITALAEMTEGGGEITKNSIVRPGQTLKHLAVIISNRATKTLHHTANATQHAQV